MSHRSPITRGLTLVATLLGLLGAVEAQAAADCESWPPAGESAPRINALPNVPALVVAGRHDVNTPTEDARKVVSLMPRGTLLEVPRAGHGALGNACSRKALDRFFADRPVGNPCRR